MFFLKSGQEYLPLRGSEMTSSWLLTNETINSYQLQLPVLGPHKIGPVNSFTNEGEAHKALSFIAKIIGY